MKTLRIKMGLSQQAFGEVLGTYQAVVSAMERGKADSRIRAFLERIERLEAECAENCSAIKK